MEHQKGFVKAVAYLRVRKPSLNQVSSVELLEKRYKDRIDANPEWQYSGIYIDEGFGSVENGGAPAFMQMITDALVGKFQIIITKSISRFAHSIGESLTYVKKLKSANPPVAVLFESEGINTLNEQDEQLLNVIAELSFDIDSKNGNPVEKVPGKPENRK